MERDQPHNGEPGTVRRSMSMSIRQQPCISIPSTKSPLLPCSAKHLANIQQLCPILVFAPVSPRPPCPQKALIAAHTHMRLVGPAIPCQHQLRDLPTAYRGHIPCPPADLGMRGLAHHTPSVDPDSWSGPSASSGWPLQYDHPRNRRQTYWELGLYKDHSSLVGHRSQGRRGRVGWG